MKKQLLIASTAALLFGVMAIGQTESRPPPKPYNAVFTGFTVIDNQQVKVSITLESRKWDLFITHFSLDSQALPFSQKQPVCRYEISPNVQIDLKNNPSINWVNFNWTTPDGGKIEGLLAAEGTYVTSSIKWVNIKTGKCTFPNPPKNIPIKKEN